MVTSGRARLRPKRIVARLALAMKNGMNSVLLKPTAARMVFAMRNGMNPVLRKRTDVNAAFAPPSSLLNSDQGA